MSYFLLILCVQMFSWCCIGASEVLPAVLDSEVSVDVVKWGFVLVRLMIDENVCPLGCVFNEWELGAPFCLVLESHGDTIVPPCDVLA